jgi:hypothetical protein
MSSIPINGHRECSLDNHPAVEITSRPIFNFVGGDHV